MKIISLDRKSIKIKLATAFVITSITVSYLLLQYIKTCAAECGEHDKSKS